MQDAVRQFETEMTAVLVEQWRGCSWQVAELGARSLVFTVFCGQVDSTVWWQARRSRRVCRPRVSRRARQRERTWSPSLRVSRRARRRERTWSPSPSAEVTSRSAAACACVCVIMKSIPLPCAYHCTNYDVRKPVNLHVLCYFSHLCTRYTCFTRGLYHKVSVGEKSLCFSPVVVVVWVFDVRLWMTV